MSEVAGRMATRGARFWKSPRRKGKTDGGVPAYPPARVLILGGGVVGTNAAQMAAGMGTEGMITDVNLTPALSQRGIAKNVKNTLFSPTILKWNCLPWIW